jgi:hypothetical protein
MVHDVFSLHQIVGGNHVKFPFSIPDYQRYVFGDDKLAHQFGTDLAKAFIARGSGYGGPDTTTTSNQSLAHDVAVAVLSEYAPTATHNLRDHFTAHLNRHLITHNGGPARKIDITRTKDGSPGRGGPHAFRHHIDSAYLGRRTLVILGDIRMGADQEDSITESLKLASTVIFVYLAALDTPDTSAALSSTLSTIVSPSIKVIDNIAQSPRFSMTEAFARCVLGREYSEFCRFLRGQDDCLARRLLDYAIGGGYGDDDMYEQNFKFLMWEMEARESV